MYQWMQAYDFWLERLYNMAYSCISWKGLEFNYNPSSILLPENFLIDKGQCVIFEDEYEGFVCLPCIGEGALDIYGKPYSYQAYGCNGYTKSGLIPNKNCVIILNNPMRTTEHSNINMFAKRLTNSMITGDINLYTHRTPVIVECDDDMRFSVEQILAKIEGGATKVVGNSALSHIELKALNLNSPYIVDKIMENTQSIWNEWLNYLGVPGQVVQKKERMLKDEVTQTMGGSLASRVPRMQCRDKAVEDLKEVFGWNASYDFAVDYVPVPQYIGEDDKDESISNFDGSDGNDFGEE